MRTILPVKVLASTLVAALAISPMTVLAAPPSHAAVYEKDKQTGKNKSDKKNTDKITGKDKARDKDKEQFLSIFHFLKLAKEKGVSEGQALLMLHDLTALLSASQPSSSTTKFTNKHNKTFKKLFGEKVTNEDLLHLIQDIKVQFINEVAADKAAGKQRSLRLLLKDAITKTLQNPTHAKIAAAFASAGLTTNTIIELLKKLEKRVDSDHTLRNIINQWLAAQRPAPPQEPPKEPKPPQPPQEPPTEPDPQDIVPFFDINYNSTVKGFDVKVKMEYVTRELDPSEFSIVEVVSGKKYNVTQVKPGSNPGEFVLILDQRPVGEDVLEIRFHDSHTYAYYLVRGYWEKVADLEEPLTSGESAQIGNTVYIPKSNKELVAFDMDTKTFSKKAPMPYRTIGIAIVAHKGLLYCFGGYDLDSDLQIVGTPLLDVVQIYDPATDTWTVKDAPVLAESVAASVGDKIYIAGGWTPGGPDYRFDVYDPSSGTLTRKPGGLPDGGQRATVIGSKIYYIGDPTGNAHIYNTETGKWEVNYDEFVNELTEFSGHATAFIDGKIYLIGGRDGKVSYYDPTTNKVTNLPELTTGLSRYNVVYGYDEKNKKLYVIGGSTPKTRPDGSGSDYVPVLSVDVLTFIPPSQE